ncbi:MAG: 50S ribosomal protein L4 [Candidatus Magasanikbacteria bacterium]|nr:50S ribosomal protein L4 [Candidatus Magasanikbacteria bacterium]|tara:strand:- start:444 stop:1070 length:627 start_codon:yes stop_codon:yes gene_type:complete
MPKVTMYNQEGKEASQIDISEEVFNTKKNTGIVHQIYLALEANARQPWAHTKDRSEVRGGGKKPWKQKGTGRARHGSRRSPIWSGGGITFGPLNIRNYKQKINKKMSKKAMKVCLSDKVRNNSFIVLDSLESNGKTKQFAALRKLLPGSGKSTLLLVEGNDKSIGLAVRNIPQVNMQSSQNVNVVDLLHHKYILATKTAVDMLEKRLA